MRLAIPISTVRKLCWVGIVPLLVGASLALLQYAGWAAVYSGSYGLPWAAALVKEAAGEAQFFFYVLTGFSLAAFAAVLALIPPPLDEDASPSLRLLLRITIAAPIVAASIFAIAAGISIVGQHFK